MKYAGLIDNDIADGNGVCVSFWCQGCPFHCKGCHNPGTWDFNQGMDLPDNMSDIIIKKISQNGIKRNFSILGGEPLCKENRKMVSKIVTDVRNAYPDIKIFCWTGDTCENLISEADEDIDNIFSKIDILVDGPFKIDKRDVTLKLRGSSNQRVIDMKKTLENEEVTLANKYN